MSKVEENGSRMNIPFSLCWNSLRKNERHFLSVFMCANDEINMS